MVLVVPVVVAAAIEERKDLYPYFLMKLVMKLGPLPLAVIIGPVKVSVQLFAVMRMIVSD